MIVLKNVTKKYGRLGVLSDVSFSVTPGEFVCITGPSGAGKSTLLSLLIGAEGVSSGSVSVDSVDLKQIPAPAMQLFRRRVGYMFQDYRLLPHATVRENIAFPLEVCGQPDEAIRQRVTELVDRMKLDK